MFSGEGGRAPLVSFIYAYLHIYNNHPCLFLQIGRRVFAISVTLLTLFIGLCLWVFWGNSQLRRGYNIFAVLTSYKMLILNLFRNSWGDSYKPSLLLIITLSFTCGEIKIWSNIRKSQNIMTMILEPTFITGILISQN